MRAATMEQPKKPAPPQAVKPSSITPVPWTPILLKTVLVPQPFRGSDGKTHIIYDLIFQNFWHNGAAVEKLDLLDTEGSPIRSFNKGELASVMVNPYADMVTDKHKYSLMPGGTAAAFLLLDFVRDTDVPDVIRHRVTVSVSMFEPGKVDHLTYEAAPTVVDKRPPIVIAAPLSGGNWLAGGGWDGLEGHRRALFAVGNRLKSAQCYAIDWIRLDDSNRSSRGDSTKNESDLAYGQPVFAVADGTISGALDRFPDQIPNQAAGNDRFDYPEGNSVVQDIGNDLFVLYAHFKPGTLKVKAGQRVKRGQLLGLVGNSGNSSGAHLHMQVMDAAHPIAADGVPYVFDSFKIVGEVTDMNKAYENASAGLPQQVEQTAACGDHKHELPREGSIIVFPELQTH